jgi:hypothetical protein
VTPFAGAPLLQLIDTECEIEAGDEKHCGIEHWKMTVSVAPTHDAQPCNQE